MNTAPKISVIVPVYNCEKYIDRCINGILNQTFTDFELILMNDGSTDNSLEVCREYAKKDNRIHVFSQKNLGQAAARNNAVQKAQAEWLAFVDADDYTHPQLLRILYSAITDENVKIAMCGALQGDTLPDTFCDSVENAQTKVITTDEENLLNLCKNEKYYYWVVWGKLINKSLFLAAPLTEGRIYEDNAAVPRWLHTAQKVAITPAQLYFYRVNTSGTTKSGFTSKQLDVLWAFEEQIVFFKNLGYTKLVTHLLSRYFEIAANLYARAESEPNGKSYIKKIKQNTTETKKKYADFIHLSGDEKLYIYERTSPVKFFLTRVKRKLFGI